MDNLEMKFHLQQHQKNKILRNKFNKITARHTLKAIKYLLKGNKDLNKGKDTPCSLIERQYY